MELLTAELIEKLPRIGQTEHEDDAIVHCKFFTPDSGWTWYVLEYDGADLFFGLVVGLEREYGYFRLSELRSVRGALGLPVERDLYFSPQRLSEVERG